MSDYYKYKFLPSVNEGDRPSDVDLRGSIFIGGIVFVIFIALLTGGGSGNLLRHMSGELLISLLLVAYLMFISYFSSTYRKISRWVIAVSCWVLWVFITVFFAFYLQYSDNYNYFWILLSFYVYSFSIGFYSSVQLRREYQLSN